MSLAQKIGLGSVQWGMSYGIANRSGRPGDLEVQDILKLTTLANIDLLDTAHAYGDAEDVIGRIVPKASPWRIVTKTMPITSDKVTEGDLLCPAFKTCRLVGQLGINERPCRPNGRITRSMRKAARER